VDFARSPATEQFSRKSRRTGKSRHTGIEAERSFGRGKRGIEIVTELESGGLSHEPGTSIRNRVSRQRESRQLDTKAKETNPMQQKADSQEVNA
jgi:hypothetical protein